MRFEVKFSYPTHFDSQVMVWVKAHSQGFRTAYPPRRINNVYFDTPSFDTQYRGYPQRFVRTENRPLANLRSGQPDYAGRHFIGVEIGLFGDFFADADLYRPRFVRVTGLPQ